MIGGCLKCSSAFDRRIGKYRRRRLRATCTGKSCSPFFATNQTAVVHSGTKEWLASADQQPNQNTAMSQTEVMVLYGGLLLFDCGRFPVSRLSVLSSSSNSHLYFPRGGVRREPGRGEPAKIIHNLPRPSCVGPKPGTRNGENRKLTKTEKESPCVGPTNY